MRFPSVPSTLKRVLPAKSLRREAFIVGVGVVVVVGGIFFGAATFVPDPTKPGTTPPDPGNITAMLAVPTTQPLPTPSKQVRTSAYLRHLDGRVIGYKARNNTTWRFRLIEWSDGTVTVDAEQTKN